MITIRQAIPSDTDILYEWGRKNWQLWGDTIDKIWYNRKALAQWIEESEKDVLLVAVDDARPVGMCFVHNLRTWAMFDAFFVIEEYRSHGVGDLLFSEAEKIFRKRGVFDFELMVDPGNSKAIEFYEKKGYKKSNTYVWMVKDVKGDSDE